MAAPAHRTERLLNLVICLLSTRSWLTKEQIRAAVPQYADCATDEAFDRMFERDKEDLRELGVPLVTGSHSDWFEDEVGYRIDRSAYALPDVEFTAEELAVLGLASRVWQQASLAGPAARALVKLKALGVETDEESLVGVEPRVRAAEPAFEPLYAATRDRAPVTFAYRTREGDAATRHLEPWALTSRGGHWYVVGHDRDRRRTPLVPAVADRGRGPPERPRGVATRFPPTSTRGELVAPAREQPDDRAAVLRVRAGRAVLLRAACDRGRAGGGGGLGRRPRARRRCRGARPGGRRPTGPTSSSLDPPDVRAVVVRTLQEALRGDRSGAEPTRRPARRGAAR